MMLSVDRSRTVFVVILQLLSQLLCKEKPSVFQCIGCLCKFVSLCGSGIKMEMSLDQANKRSCSGLAHGCTTHIGHVIFAKAY